MITFICNLILYDKILLKIKFNSASLLHKTDITFIIGTRVNLENIKCASS